MKSCPSCHAKVVNDWKFCNKCGAKRKKSNGNNSRIIIGVVVIVIIVGFGFFAYSEISQRKALEDIEISLQDVNFSRVGFTSATLSIWLDMYNPNDITATLDRADYEVYLNDNYVGSGQISSKTSIPAYSSTIVKTNFDVAYSGIGPTLISAISNQQIIVRLSGQAYYDTPFGTLTIPFSLTR